MERLGLVTISAPSLRSIQTYGWSEIQRDLTEIKKMAARKSQDGERITQEQVPFIYHPLRRQAAN